MGTKEKFEEIYSISIRRGEDSSVVWEWLRDHLTDERKQLLKDLKSVIKDKFTNHGYHVGKKEFVSMTEKQFLEMINSVSKLK